ncbi:uncharacterized protein LOC135831985 [Planococcus citri]|uniref:uncharacterized protein LOC135831985 n=1 Tax=Planococcus citri TaxID=170843 RepID=UPI0031FA1293
MLALKPAVFNCQPHKRLFSTTSWNGRRMYTYEEMLKMRGPRCVKPHRVMWKFLEKTKKTGIFFQPPVGFPSFSLKSAVTSIACRTIPVTRKSAILNKLFMRNITEILATSDVGLPLIGYDIQISQVRVTPDFRAINVFWIPQGTDKDDEIQHLLNETANPLRSELINLRTMGLVPVIYFVKDKHYALQAEVDRRLKIADFGEDYVPALQEHHHLKEDLQLITTLPSQVKEKIANLEDDQPFEYDEEQELPAMRMDVFGLNHSKILHTVKQAVSKSRLSGAKGIEDILNNPKAVFEIPSNSILDKDVWDRNSFKKYIKQRQRKIKKAQQASADEMEMIHTHYIETYEASDNDPNLHNEFVEHAFEDELESSENFDQCDDRYEQEQ